MKKFYSLRFIIVLTAFTTGIGGLQAQTEQELFPAPAEGDDAWTTAETRTSQRLSPGGDSIYFLTTTITDGVFSFAPFAASQSTSAACAPAVRRVQVNSFDLVLATNTITSLSILGTSSGTSDRTLRAIFVDGVMIPPANYTVSSIQTGGASACGFISVIGLTIAPKARVTVVIGSTPSSTPQNYRVNVIYVNKGIALPVKFTGINAAAVNGMTKVTWNIATELNTRSYMVEKSTDGVTFKHVAEVTATNAGTYSWIDQSANSGNVYYRVKAVDKDGKLGYSGVIKLSTVLTKPGFVITPNVIPGRTMNLQLTNIVKGTVTIRVSNNMGQIVYSSSLINEGGSVSKTISLPGTLQAGTYRVQLVSGSTMLTQTAILQ